MSGKKEFFAGVVFGAMLSLPSFATPETPFSASARAAVLQTLATELITNYIDPAVAKRVGNAIAKKNAQGGYASAASAQAFSAALAKDLRELRAICISTSSLMNGY